MLSKATYTLGPLVVVLMVLSSCASLSLAPRDDDFIDVVSLINAGDAEELSARSALPFLFDGEIVDRSDDVETIWRTLAEKGFTIHGNSSISTSSVNESTYVKFAESMEVSAYFERHVPKKSKIGSVVGPTGAVTILLGPDAATILGLRIQ